MRVEEQNSMTPSSMKMPNDLKKLVYEYCGYRIALQLAIQSLKKQAGCLSTRTEYTDYLMDAIDDKESIIISVLNQGGAGHLHEIVGEILFDFFSSSGDAQFGLSHDEMSLKDIMYTETSYQGPLHYWGNPKVQHLKKVLLTAIRVCFDKAAYKYCLNQKWPSTLNEDDNKYEIVGSRFVSFFNDLALLKGSDTSLAPKRVTLVSWLHEETDSYAEIRNNWIADFIDIYYDPTERQFWDLIYNAVEEGKIIVLDGIEQIEKLNDVLQSIKSLLDSNMIHKLGGRCYLPHYGNTGVADGFSVVFISHTETLHINPSITDILQNRYIK